MIERKKKTYGDASAFVGTQLDIDARVVIVDDVFTTGETKIEAVDKIERIIKAKVVGIVIAVDRQEKGVKLGAIEEFTNKTGIPVHSVATIKDVFEHLRNRNIEGKIYVDNRTYESFVNYRKKYGI